MTVQMMPPGSVQVMYRREGTPYPSGQQSFTLYALVDRKKADEVLNTGNKAVSFDDGAGGVSQATWTGVFRDYNQVRLMDVYALGIAAPAAGAKLSASSFSVLNIANGARASALSQDLDLLSKIGAGI